MIVLDASVVLELLMRTARGAAAAKRLRSGQYTLHAPHLLDLEVASAVRRLNASGALDERRGREGLRALSDLPIHRYPGIGRGSIPWTPEAGRARGLPRANPGRVGYISYLNN